MFILVRMCVNLYPCRALWILLLHFACGFSLSLFVIGLCWKRSNTSYNFFPKMWFCFIFLYVLMLFASVVYVTLVFVWSLRVSVLGFIIYTSAKFPFYLALYASVGQELKHIMARWHFCNSNQVLCLSSANTRSQR